MDHKIKQQQQQQEQRQDDFFISDVKKLTNFTKTISRYLFVYMK